MLVIDWISFQKIPLPCILPIWFLTPITLYLYLFYPILYFSPSYPIVGKFRIGVSLTS